MSAYRLGARVCHTVPGRRAASGPSQAWYRVVILPARQRAALHTHGAAVGLGAAVAAGHGREVGRDARGEDLREPAEVAARWLAGELARKALDDRDVHGL